MSKKNGKKPENGAGKGSEMNPDSQKWRDEDARKHDEAYTMVQRAMFSSQVCINSRMRTRRYVYIYVRMYSVYRQYVV